jgi:2-oxoglutarate dehydrogenase E1 component
MVLFTPKSLLRHPKAISSVKELALGSFERVIDDNENTPEEVTRLVFCSGKLYYELLKRKNDLQANDIALVRIEQVYPLPVLEIDNIVKKYSNAIQILWVQEEPMNMGAWYFIRNELQHIPIIGVYRQPSGSPAVGLSEIHQQQQEEILNKVFKPCTCERKLPYCGLQCKTGKERIPIMKQYKYFKAEI